MNTDQHPGGFSRRSFLKKTALAAGIPTATLFTGLLQAETPDMSGCIPGSPCPLSKPVVPNAGPVLYNGSFYDVVECTCSGTPGCCMPDSVTCGKWWFGADGWKTIRIGCGSMYPPAENENEWPLFGVFTKMKCIDV